MARYASFTFMVLSIGASSSSLAATTDLSSEPLLSTTNTFVHPNVMFMLDDSGSMDWDYMPDDAKKFSGKYGFNSSHCNGVYYNPAVKYAPPVKSDGTSYPDSSFTAAWKDGYDQSTGTTNLSTGFKGGSGTGSSGYTSYGPGAAFYYNYTGTQTSGAQMDYRNTASTFYKECNSAINSTPGKDVFTKVAYNTTGLSTVAELTNFANWYSYYSTRMQMMKTGVGSAFKNVSDQYRVGFLTMNNNVSPGIVDIANFNATQKSLWYTKLYAANPGNFTPLREALSHVGQLYAHKFGAVTTYKAAITVGGSGATAANSIKVNGIETLNCAYLISISDPDAPASCPSASTTAELAKAIADQINAMVNTDYGASVSGSVVTITGIASSLGATPVITKDSGGMTFTATPFTTTTVTAQLNGITPADPMQYSCQQNFVILSTDGYWNGSTTYKLDNTTVGNQDGTEVRPMLDGASNNTTIITPYTTTQIRATVTSGATTTKTWTKTTTTIGAACSTPAATLPAGCIQGHNGGTTRTWCMELNANNGSNCTGAFGTGSQVYACRGSGNSTNLPGGDDKPCETDSSGAKWCLFVNNTTAGTNSCTLANSNYDLYVCAITPAVTGKYVTATPYTQSEVISGATSTLYSTYTASQTTTQVITNGVAGTIGALTPATPAYSLSSSNTVTSAATSDTCSGQNGLMTPCPNTAGAWAAGTANPNNVCTATASLPSAGTTTPAITATSTTPGTTGAQTVVSTTGPTAGTPTSTSTSSGGTSNTLADVAEYYYVTDLRDNSLANCSGALGTDVCYDAPISKTNPNPKQHMTTFTLGLGARGRMVNDPGYLSRTTSCNTATDGDFCAVLKGATASSSVCTWQSAGAVCNWPTPSSGAIENIDDLWHAAVNGRGEYFSATDPTTLEAGLAGALTGIASRLSAGSASATSNPNITPAEHSIFSSTYATGKWTGEVTAQLVNTTTGAVLPLDLTQPGNWQAQAQLDNLAQLDCASKAATPTCGTPDISSSRKIYTFDSANASGNKLKNFTYDKLTGTEQNYFDSKCSATFLSQCSTGMSTTALANGNLGTNLVNYLRGNQSMELSVSAGSFRFRDHLLGDTVNAKPVYVKVPQYSFTDKVTPSYSTFKSENASRQSVLYVGANDGMLHAFNADTGAEMWAYVPKIVMPNLYKLADRTYGTNKPHQSYVDGSPETMDIYVATAANNLTVGWHTILVGGLGLGGRGYYALDVTDPLHPKALWEICDSALCAIFETDMGYSYGNPVITKRSSDNKWVVLLTSGYNNNGTGMLYTLDAVTGIVLDKTSTGTGSAASPSGLAKLSPWVDSNSTNLKTRFIYGGDLNGDVWRFDLGAAGSNVAPKVKKVASLVVGSGVSQPVTTRVELGDPLNNTTDSLGGTGTPAVFVATGRYLGLTDLSNLQVQSVYGIKDDLSKTTGIGNPRASGAGFVRQYIYNIGAGDTSRTSSTYAVNWASDPGWFADFVVTNPATNLPISPSVSPGERVNIDPQLLKGWLVVVTNVPDDPTNSLTNPCSFGGTSWLYFFNFLTGQYVSTANNIIVGQKFSDLTAGISLYDLSGKVMGSRMSSGGGGSPITLPSQPAAATRRTSWRELTQ